MPGNTTDNLFSGAEARGGLIAGIRKCAAAVGVTMGTSGKNSLIEAIENPGHLSTNDGITILENIKLADPLEEMGRKVLLEAVKRANKQSGDGSSTATVLTAAIIEEGLKYLDKYPAMEIKRSLEACIPLIEDSINGQKRDITVNEVKAVASISAEDEEIGARIQEIYQQIGKEGIIHWDVSKTAEDTYQIGSGITIDGAGFFSPYMCDAEANGQSTNQVRIKNPKIAIAKQKLSTAADFNTLAAKLNDHEIKDLIVFVDDVDPLVVPDLIRTRMMRGFRIVIVKMPTLWKDWWFEDLTKAVGATMADPNAGLPLSQLKMEHLGTVANILITKDTTYLDGIKDVSAHIQALEESGTDEDKLRASRLNTKTARYFVGALSESALAYRRLKVEDAIAASWQALQNGIVAGGGVSLINCRLKLTDDIGGQILKHALTSPMKQIMLNSGYSFTEYSEETKGNLPSKIKTWGGENGFNTKTNQLVNMFEANIVDPANIVLNAVKNAISVAATVLTTETIITLPRQQQPMPYVQ